MRKNRKLDVIGTEVVYFTANQEDFISLTDIARHRDADRSDYILQNWLRNRSTIEFIGLWEQFHNPHFNSIEFDGIKSMAGSNSFSLTPKRWIESTNAIGIVSKTGRYGGTFAHKDIAFEFASWLSAEFKFYLIKEFQRLKQEESNHNQLEWNVQRALAKVNYTIHTDAIKENLIPKLITTQQATQVYANEADLLNVALFGFTAKMWRDNNPEKKGNLRDHATLEQLVVLSNLESINALLLQQGLNQHLRLTQLNQVAISQMKSLIQSKTLNNIKRK
jgi:hypothetical protein